MPDSHTEIAAVEKLLTVPLKAPDAFALFVDRLPDWWPTKSHSISAGLGETVKAVAVDPSENGQIVETTQDGQDHVWGHFADFIPNREVEIAWYVGRTRSQATRIKVTFTEVAGQTNVRLIHDKWEALGKGAAKVAEGYRTGWDIVLAEYAAAAN